jgi:hypothetical protein
MLNALFILLFSAPAQGAIGIPVEKRLLPVQTCLIRFVDGSDKTVETCSGTILSPLHLQTAAHCFERSNGEIRPHHVLCPGGRENRATRVIFSRGFISQEAMRDDDSLRRFDAALLVLERPESSPGMAVVRSLPALKTLLNETSACAVFGYGGVHPLDNAYGKLQGVQVDPRVIRAEPGQPLITANLGGWNSGLVEPGDSGGSLACQDRAKRWHLIGVTAARTYSYSSLFAPIFENLEIFQGVRFANSQDELAHEQELLLSQSREQLRDMTEAYRKGMSGAGDAQADAWVSRISKLSSEGEAGRLRSEISSAKRKVLQMSSGATVRLRPYSLLELDFANPESLEAQERDKQHLTGNPVSTVDQVYNRFVIKGADEGQATGDLLLYGHSDYFLCRENVLCGPGTYRNVKVPLSQLDFETLRR